MRKASIITFVAALGAIAVIAATILYQRGGEVSAAGEASGQAAQALQTTPLTTGNFLLEISGITEAGGDWWFLDGVDIKLDVIPIREGGASSEIKVPGDIPHYSPDGIVFRRPFMPEKPNLRNWFNKTAEGLLDRRSGSIIFLDRSGTEVTRFNFFEAWPSSYRLTSLGSAQVLGCSNCADMVLQEEFTIQVERIETDVR